MSQLENPLDTWWRGEELPKEMFRWFRALRGRIVWGAFTWDVPSLSANTTTDTTLTTATSDHFDLLRSGMLVSITPPSTLNAGVTVGAAWVATDRELTIRLGNLTGVAIDPASGTWGFFAWMP